MLGAGVHAQKLAWGEVVVPTQKPLNNEERSTSCMIAFPDIRRTLSSTPTFFRCCMAALLEAIQCDSTGSEFMV